MQNAMIDQISRQKNGSAVGIWGRHLLKSAFQPIFAFVHGKLEIAAYEGLIRPFENGVGISPGKFFESINRIDRFKVETLTRTLHVFNASQVIGAKASLFLNFDPSVFTDRSIADDALKDLRLVLGRAGVDPARVVCELIEKKSGHEEALFAFVHSLRAHGFRIAVDDYGADDSDFQRIKDMSPDIVKFDAAWITRLMESDPGFALLAAMVAKFRRMGITTVFEGIEENWQLDLADRCGVDMEQGFILARPEIVQTDGPVEGKVSAIESIPTPSETSVVMATVAHKAPGRTFGRRAATP